MSIGTTADVFAPRKQLFQMLQQGRRQRSERGAAPHAPLELLYLFPASCCSRCSSGAPNSAPRKELQCTTCSIGNSVFAPRKQLLQRLQRSQAEPPSVLQDRSCSTRSIGNTVFAPRKQLLMVLKRSGPLCSEEGAAPLAPVEPPYSLPESSCCRCSIRPSGTNCRKNSIKRRVPNNRRVSNKRRGFEACVLINAGS